jgi:hypothetical protein
MPIYTLTGSRAFLGLACLFCTQIFILLAGLFGADCAKTQTKKISQLPPPKVVA